MSEFFPSFFSSNNISNLSHSSLEIFDKNIVKITEAIIAGD